MEVMYTECYAWNGDGIFFIIKSPLPHQETSNSLITLLLQTSSTSSDLSLPLSRRLGYITVIRHKTQEDFFY